MKTSIITVFWLFFLFLTDSHALDVKALKTAEGMQIILHQDHSFDAVAVEFWVKSGFKDENHHQHGLAHFFEHVMPAGRLENPENMAFFKQNRLEYNAQTLMDFTRYSLEVRPAALETALKFTASRINSHADAITKKSIEFQRNRVLQEIQRNDKVLLWNTELSNQININIFGAEHPYNHSVYGNISNNKNFQLDDFRAWHQQTMHPDNIILFIAGNFDYSTIQKWLSKTFGILTKVKLKPQNPTCFDNQQSEKNRYETSINGTEHNAYVLAWTAPCFGHPDGLSYEALSAILLERLNETFSNSTHNSKIEVSLASGLYQLTGKTTLLVNASSATDHKTIKSKIKTVIQNLPNNITQSELMTSINKIKQNNQSKMSYLGFGDSRIEILGKALLYMNNPSHHLAIDKEIKHLSVGQLSSVAKKWFPFQITETKQ